MLYIIIKGKNEDDFFIQANRVINMYETNELINDIDWDIVDIFYWESESSFKSNIPSAIRNVPENVWLKCSSYEDLEYLKQLMMSEREYVYYLKVVNKRINSNDEERFDVITLRYFSMMRRTYKGKIFLEIEDNGKDNGNEKRISGYMFIDNLVEMNVWECQWRKEKKIIGISTVL